MSGENSESFASAIKDRKVEPLFSAGDGAVADVLALGDKYRGKRSELTPQDIQAILKAHNDLRARYGVQPLQWSEQLASHAKQWADTCYWGHWKAQRTKTALGGDYFPPPQQMGENLSVWRDPGSTLLAGQYGTQLWLNEEKDFDCETGQCIPGRMCGHWTQMVWEDTKRVGCALRTCEDGMDSRSWPSSTIGIPGVQYLVCEYDPPGNYTGERPFPRSQCNQPGLPPGSPAPQPKISVGKTYTPSEPPKQAAPPPAQQPQQPQQPQPRQPIVPRTTPGAGMIAQNENMSSVPEFFQGLGRGNRPVGGFQRRVYVPGGVTLVEQPQRTVELISGGASPPDVPEPEAPETPMNGVIANEKKNENALIENEIAPPAPEPLLSGKAPPTDAQKIGAAAGGALAVGAALGAALGAGFYFLNESLQRKNR